MTHQYEYYLKYMQKASGYRATWDPKRKMVVGTIGRLDSSGQFHKLYKLEDFHIVPKIETDESNSTGEMDRTSSNSVSINAKLSGSAPIPGSMLSLEDTGFNISFKGENGIVFKLGGYSIEEIVNIGKIEEKVIALYNDEQWDKSWLIVSQVIRAKSATILVSTGNSSNIDIKAKAKVGQGAIKLTDVKLGLSTSDQSGATTHIIAQKGITPLYIVMGLESPLFSRTKLNTKKAVDPNAPVKFEKQPYLEGEVMDEGDE